MKYQKLLVFLLVTFLAISASAVRRQHVQTASTSAISWTFFEGDDFDVDAITFKFDAAPTTSENLTVTLDSGQGAAYDTVLASVDPVGATEVVVRNIAGLKNGDKIIVEYTNTDGNSIVGVATALLGSDKVDGSIAVYLDGIEQVSVSVSSLPGGLTGFAEDAAHTTADVGLEVLTKRTDSAATSADTDGDYATLNTDANGRLWTHDPVLEALLTTIDSDTGDIKTATELVDDVVFIDDAAWTNDTSKHALIGGIYQSTPQTITDGRTAPISIDANGMARINIGAQSLTALAVSKDSSANAANNPIFAELTDGTTAISSSNPLNVQVGDGTNVAAIGTGTTKVQLAGIHDGELLASVQLNSAMADDFDGLNGLLTTAILHGYVDDDTTHTVLVDSSGHLQCDSLSLPTGTAVMASSTPVTIATDDTMFTALDTAVDIVAGDTTSIDGKTPALGTAVMVGSWPFTVATDDTMFTALDTAVDIVAGDTTSIDGKIPALGTAAMTGSSPVTIATDDTMITALDTAIDIIAGDTTSLDGKITACDTGSISGTVTANAGTNLNTSALALESGGNLDTIASDTTSLDSKITVCNTGAIAGTVTANAGTNLNTSALALESGGNLATIAGDTTSIDGKMPAKGQATMANSTPVAIASDQSYIPVSVSSLGSGYQTFEDSSFVTGDSPVVHDVNNDLGRNGNRGYIICDGAGNISVQISESGAVSTEDTITLKANDILSLDGMNVDQIKITWVTDSAYRILMR